MSVLETAFSFVFKWKTASTTMAASHFANWLMGKVFPIPRKFCAKLLTDEMIA